MINVAVIGASGRMGQALIKLINENSKTTLSGALVRAGNENVGKEINGVKYTDDIDSVFSTADVVIDFTPAGATKTHLEKAKQHNTKMIIGSTGLGKTDEQLIEDAGKDIAIVYASNFSIGVNTLFAICEKVGGVLGSDKFTTHIDETHHIHKVDAPSGTALSLGKEIAKSRNDNFDDVYKYEQDRSNNKDITFSDNRKGEVIGDHTVSFNNEMESLHLTHNAHNRDVFADGAVFASIWINDKDKGLYSMRDVLGL
ncbi:MAG: 4-hydroxy-tetrahydrodipicolinate reductase [Alphaproteobacteria bacterium]